MKFDLIVVIVVYVFMLTISEYVKVMGFLHPTRARVRYGKILWVATLTHPACNQDRGGAGKHTNPKLYRTIKKLMYVRCRQTCDEALH